jgi:hypothetical protein
VYLARELWNAWAMAQRLVSTRQIRGQKKGAPTGAEFEAKKSRPKAADD